jgi:hypothetical protein
MNDRFLILAVAIGMTLSLACTAWYGETVRFPDEESYLGLARSLADHGSFTVDDHPTAYRPPGYPFFMAVLLRAGSPVWGLKVANALLIGGSILLLYALIRRFASRDVALTGATLAALYPLFHYTASTLYPQTAGSFLLLFSLLTLLDPSEKRHTLLISGIAYGLLILMIPAFIMKLLLLAPLLCGLRLIPPKRFACFLLITVAVVMPWTVRNALVFDAIIPVSTNSGINLLLGNSPHTEPNAGVNVSLSDVVDKDTSVMTEPGQDAYYKKTALNWVLENPIQAGRLYALKALNYFNFYNELYVREAQNMLTLTISFLSYYPLLLLFFLYVWRHRAIMEPLPMFLALFYIGSAFLDAIFFTRIRFRLKMDWIMIAVAAPIARDLILGFIANRTGAKTLFQAK